MLAFKHPDAWGFIPFMLSEADPRSAAEQLNSGYAHGGGWRPFKGFQGNAETLSLTYPGDPTLRPLDTVKLRDETIALYPFEWVAVWQAAGTFEVSRMD